MQWRSSDGQVRRTSLTKFNTLKEPLYYLGLFQLTWYGSARRR
jgi:hypothetical protein